jgi:hypothetical protein
MPDFHLFAKGPRPVAPFSHAVEADGWVILTGQMPTDPAAPDAPLPEGVEAQTRRVMDNLALILANSASTSPMSSSAAPTSRNSSATTPPSTRRIRRTSRKTAAPRAPPWASRRLPWARSSRSIAWRGGRPPTDLPAPLPRAATCC